MLLIPLGLIPVFFYINIPVGDLTVDVLPDAVGYLMIAANAWMLREKSSSFSYLVYLSAFLAVYSAAVRLIAPAGMTGIAASLLELILQLYLLKWIVDGVGDLERTVGAHLNTDVLNRWRLCLSAAWAAIFVCATASALAPGIITMIGLLAVVIWGILCILFLLTLLRTDRRYKLLLRSGPPKPDWAEEDDGGDTDENGRER